MVLQPPLRLLSFASTDSTNEEIRRRAKTGAPEGTAVVAETQTAGRGRRGRTWISPPGNLYCSLLLRPQCATRDAANLSFAAALAVAEALLPLLPEGIDLRFKWPNDVLLTGKKVAGILIESEIEGGALSFAVVGAGINIANFPPDTEFPATSLAAVGCRTTVHEVMDAYFDHLRFWYGRWRSEGFAPLRDAWLARAAGIGQVIDVRMAHERLRGKFSELDDSGALILETDAGQRAITAGDVFFAGGN